MEHAEENKIPGERWLSHNIFFPEQTTTLEPLATVRPSGQLHCMAKSAVRALEIVELMVNAGKPLRACAIAHALEISPSSLDQLLKTLVDSAYLIFDSRSKHYHLSPRLSKLGTPLASAYFKPGGLEQFMAAVHADLRRSVYLMTSQGSYMQAIDVLYSPSDSPGHLIRSAGFNSDIAARIPLFGSSSGVAWLATQTPEVIRAAISRCRHELGALAKRPHLIFDAIRRAREQGFAIGGLLAEGRCGTAVALPEARNGVVLVASVKRPLDELRSPPDEVIRTFRSRIDQFLA